MTKQEAEAFVARNPRIKDAILERNWKNLDALYLFADTESAEDGLVNIIEVIRALK